MNNSVRSGKQNLTIVHPCLTDAQYHLDTSPFLLSAGRKIHTPDNFQQFLMENGSNFNNVLSAEFTRVYGNIIFTRHTDAQSSGRNLIVMGFGKVLSGEYYSDMTEPNFIMVGKTCAQIHNQIMVLVNWRETQLAM